MRQRKGDHLVWEHFIPRYVIDHVLWYKLPYIFDRVSLWGGSPSLGGLGGGGGIQGRLSFIQARIPILTFVCDDVPQERRGARSWSLGRTLREVRLEACASI